MLNEFIAAASHFVGTSTLMYAVRGLDMLGGFKEDAAISLATAKASNHTLACFHQGQDTLSPRERLRSRGRHKKGSTRTPERELPVVVKG
jgi:hypothetical protein